MPNQSAPLYLKIAQTIKEEIQEEAYRIGDLLPTEDEFVDKFKASRTTIRNAIGILEREGYVVRRQGKGTIVKNLNGSQRLHYISSFTETYTQRGARVETGNLTVKLVQPPARVAGSLDLQGEEGVYLVQRTRIVDGTTIAFQSNYLLARVVPGLEGWAERLKKTGLYQLLEGEYKLKLQRAEEEISVYLSGPLDTEVLSIPERTPLFHLVRTTYLDDGTAFEQVNSIIRADMHKYTVYLEGRPIIK